MVLNNERDAPPERTLSLFHFLQMTAAGLRPAVTDVSPLLGVRKGKVIEFLPFLCNLQNVFC